MLLTKYLPWCFVSWIFKILIIAELCNKKTKNYINNGWLNYNSQNLIVNEQLTFHVVKPWEDAKSIQTSKWNKDKDFVQNPLDHWASWACPNEILFNTVRWILIWIKKECRTTEMRAVFREAVALRRNKRSKRIKEFNTGGTFGLEGVTALP